MIATTLFSGIGAPECAMPHWDWRWHAEIEKFPNAVFAARHPNSVNLGDINAEDFVERAEQIGRPDVIVFGSPCQDFSIAGQRVGLDGDRGNLALVALGIARRLRPRWVVFENVPGLLSSYSGSAEAERSLRNRGLSGNADIGAYADAEEDSDFAAFLTLVQQCRYFGAYRIVDAQFAGVPQRRRRIFAVFHLGDWRPAAAVLFEPESLRGNNPPSREEGEGVTGTISARAEGGGGLGTDFDLSGGLDEAAGEPEPGLSLPGMRGGERRDVVADVRMVRGESGRDDGPLAAPDGPVGAVSAKWSKGTGGPAGDECYNLVTAFKRAQIGKPYDRTDYRPGVAGTIGPYDPECIAFSCKDWGGDAAPEQAPTLRSMEFDNSHANGGGQVAVVIPILEAGARTGKSTTDIRAGLGDAEVGDPMYTLQSGKQHAVAINLRGREGGAMPELSDAASLRSASGGSSRSFIFKPSHFTRDKDGAPSGVSPPLGAEPDKGDQDPVLFTKSVVRRLTPRECERLQAFSDDYTLINFRGRPAADGPRYKALGNSMCVEDIRWILKRIEKFDREILHGRL